MNWFIRLCRNTGLTIHHIVKPVRDDTLKREVSRNTEEKKISGTVTLRRTTIDEIEVKKGGEDDHDGR